MKEKFFKYFKTIILWILIFNFIVNFFGFFKNLDSYFIPSKILKNPTDSTLVSQAKDIEDNLESLQNDLKDNYGENYPALGISYFSAISHYSSTTIIQNFLFSLIAGFGFGNIIYFIFIAKYKKFKLFLALLISLFISAFLLGLSDILTYTSNGEEFEFSFKNILLNMELSSITFWIVSIVLIIINKVYSTYIEIRYS